MTDIATFKLILEPAGDTQPEELAQLGRQVRRALEQLTEVDKIEPVRGEVPEGAKAGEFLLATELLLKLAPTALEGVLGIVRDYLGRSGAPPTEVVLIKEGSEIRVKFDPTTTSHGDIANLVDRLRSDRSNG